MEHLTDLARMVIERKNLEMTEQELINILTEAFLSQQLSATYSSPFQVRTDHLAV